MDIKKLRLKHGSKWRGGNRCTSINLTEDTKEAIDKLVPRGYRSAWIERWCRLGVTIQNRDRAGVVKWAKWFIAASDKNLAGWIGFSYIADIIKEDGEDWRTRKAE